MLLLRLLPADPLERREAISKAGLLLSYWMQEMPIALLLAELEVTGEPLSRMPDTHAHPC